MTDTTLVWLRGDLRVADNPALWHAAVRGRVVVVVLLEEAEEVRPLGGASRWWLHRSLEALAGELDRLGGRLVLRRGHPERVIPPLTAEVGADAVHWNRRYGPARTIDARVMVTLRDAGLRVESFAANLLFEPGTITNGGGGAYRVFTPFWNACLREPEPRHPLPEPAALKPAPRAPRSDRLAEWGLLPSAPDWSRGLAERWQPGEPAARQALEEFATAGLRDYGLRDEPAQDATSHLSPRLRFGEVSPYQVWDRLRRDLEPEARRHVGGFLRELGWREFNHSILFHHPQLATVNYRRSFDAFPWRPVNDAELDAWRRGRTGIPLVDAGMRELRHTGYVHNRVRMVVASFLVKNLLVDWRVGEQWFWDSLVDADEANNSANWQWVAGSGADAAPYFRIFNPVTQAEKFDPHRDYVRQWVPELGTGDYPEPIVDLGETRRAALAAYERVRNT